MYQTLYKPRNDGKIQFWRMEQKDSFKRSVSGLVDADFNPVQSSIVESEWKECFDTNPGKSNHRSAPQQAEFEILAEYDKRLKMKYSQDPTENKTIISPMLAHSYNKEMGWDFYSQPKLDGIRCIATSNGLFSRNNKPILSTPHIYDGLKKFLEMGLVFDGELYNHNLKNNFNKIISLTRKTKPTQEDLDESRDVIQYWIYDIVDPSKTFSERMHKLSQMEFPDFVVVVPTLVAESQEHLDSIYNNYLLDGYEGQMLRKDAVYQAKRTKDLLKRKEFVDQECVILDIKEGSGNWKGYAKVIVSELDGEPFEATIKGNQEFCKMVLDNKQQYIRGDFTVRYQNLTPGGAPRFGIAVALYQGKRDA